MKVFKFGGASVNSIERIKNIKTILQPYAEQPLVIVISAMGKTTNALEKVVAAFVENQQEQALQLFSDIKNTHIDIVHQLLNKNAEACLEHLSEFFTEVEWLLHDKPVRHYDYYYDQIVSSGELMSTAIISSYLNEVDITNTWLDARDIIKTDNNFRDASIDWTLTSEKVTQLIACDTITITQGFIGCTDENENTTLGREGSDYTAAILANILNAENVTIWKDVEGVLSADPKQFATATLISTLSFDEVIEMAYYGAQVIHPKTIKPLQNKHIPLLVKCFLNPALAGTVIANEGVKNLPPIIVLKQAQSLIQLTSNNFEFVGQQPMANLYVWLNKLHIKPNLVQTGAISVQLCIDENNEKIQQLCELCSNTFSMQVQSTLTLLTIRHYNTEIAQHLTTGKNILLQQQTTETLQVLYS